VTSASQARTTKDSKVEGGVCNSQALSSMQPDGVAGMETTDGECAIAGIVCCGMMLLLWFAKVGGRPFASADVRLNLSQPNFFYPS
jgi:hypothetical protein